MRCKLGPTISQCAACLPPISPNKRCAMSSKAGAALLTASLFVVFIPSKASAQNAFGQIAPRQVADFTRIGEDQKEALRVNEAVYQAIGFGNTFMVVTPAGNVIIDTSSANIAPRHQELLRKVNAGPIR